MENVYFTGPLRNLYAVSIRKGPKGLGLVCLPDLLALQITTLGHHRWSF